MMLRSKSRSRSIGVGQKNHHHSSLFTRTLSSHFCGGDSVATQINSKSIGKKPYKAVSSLSERDKIISLEQEVEGMEEELIRLKEKLSVCEGEKFRVHEQLNEANKRANDGLSPKKAEELRFQIENLKKRLSDSNDDSKGKDKRIGSLEEALAEKDVLLKETTVLLSENNKTLGELQGELEKKKALEKRMLDSLREKTKQLDGMEFDLQESKIEIAMLYEKIDMLEGLSKQDGIVKDGLFHEEDVIRALKSEIMSLKHQCRQAIDAEENSTKAMEGLAMALTEVAVEAKEAKEKLFATEMEVDQLKKILRGIEDRYKDAIEEAEMHKNMASQLRLEIEEAQLAWTGKELGFVSCIRLAEDERSVAQHENIRLAESLKAAENMTRAAREETYKSRDILKQALNEASTAKVAAEIAVAENTRLKDSLAEKEEELHSLSKENKDLRISETAALENVKQLKRMLAMSSLNEIRTEEREIKTEEKEKEKEEKKKENEDEEERESIEESPDDSSSDDVTKKTMGKTFSFSLEDLKFMDPHEDMIDNALVEDPEKAEALKGSIFDTDAVTPNSEPHTPKSSTNDQRRLSFSFAEVGTSSDDFFNPDMEHNDNSEDKQSNRKVKTMMRRVGDLLTIKRGFHRKEPSSLE